MCCNLDRVSRCIVDNNESCNLGIDESGGVVGSGDKGLSDQNGEDGGVIGSASVDVRDVGVGVRGEDGGVVEGVDGGVGVGVRGEGGGVVGGVGVGVSVDVRNEGSGSGSSGARSSIAIDESIGVEVDEGDSVVGGASVDVRGEDGGVDGGVGVRGEDGGVGVAGGVDGCVGVGASVVFAELLNSPCFCL